MPSNNLKNNFLQGKMELGLDSRIVPAGSYREARNISINRSDNSDIGALENLRGNRQVPVAEGLNLSASHEIIGTAIDSLKDRIYYFFVGPSVEGIYEYDLASETVSRIFEFSRAKGIFRFNVSNYITGSNVIDDLLYFTDGLNPPRKINIERFRNSGRLQDETLPFNADTNPVVSSVDPNYERSGRPLVDLDNEELTNATVSSTPPFLGDLINVGKRPPLFPPSIVNPPDAEEATSEDNLYDNYISFAYRYKYTDGEITALSPFSQSAFFPKRLRLTRPEGTSTASDAVSFPSMVNSYSEVDIKYDPGDAEVTEVELVLKYANNENIYSLSVINKEESNISSSTPYLRNYTTFRYANDKVFRVLPQDQLTRIYDAVPLKAKSQEIAGNRLVYGNYTENYNLSILNENGRALVPNFTVTHRSTARDITDDFASCTVKSDRDYEVGIVYIDREGRQTPVLLSEFSTVNIPFSDGRNRNQIQVDINTPAPYWATHYRFFIKQSKGIFYNLFPSIAEKDNADKRVYLQLDQGEGLTSVDTDRISTFVDINKVKEGDFVVLKGNAAGIQTVRREFIVEQVNPSASKIIANTSITSNTDARLENPFIIVRPVNPDDINAFGEGLDYQTIWETVPVIDSNLDVYAEYGKTFRCVNGAHTTSEEEIIKPGDVTQDIYTQLDEEVIDGSALEGDAESSITVLLEYFNCFSYTNGIEEVNILGNFNSQTLPAGIKFSTVNEEYRQREQRAFLIHSGIFNDDTNLNRFNEFNTSNLITRELDIRNGSIQKLHSRDTNLIVFQEDKVLNVPINKNLIQTADGTTQITTSSDFFNTERSYDGEYGISTNPESFATYGSRIYFTDKNRGVMLRLFNNGIEEISKNGVEFRFRDDISKADLIIGSYDDFNDQYLCTLRNRPDQPMLGVNSLNITLSSDGCPDPRAECNRDVDLITFKRYYASLQSAGRITLDIDDTIYVDEDRETLFNGNYRWYRVRNNDLSTNGAIQISPYGTITGVTTDCATDYPADTRRILFNISSEVFNSQYDACANGIVDAIAYHDGSGDEPDNQDTIYEGPQDIVRSSRTGWYLITEGNEKFTINLENGVVINKINCNVISRGRRSIVASNIIELATGITEASRNISICNVPYAESVIWFDSDNSIPEVGDLMFENNNDDDRLDYNLTTGTDTYYSSEDGYFIKIGLDDTQQFRQTDTFTGDGSTTTFTLSTTPIASADLAPTAIVSGGDTSVTVATNVATFTTAPADGASVTIGYNVAPTVVEEVGYCSETVCFNSPNNLFDQITGVNTNILSDIDTAGGATSDLTRVFSASTALSSSEIFINTPGFISQNDRWVNVRNVFVSLTTTFFDTRRSNYLVYIDDSNWALFNASNANSRIGTLVGGVFVPAGLGFTVLGVERSMGTITPGATVRIYTSTDNINIRNFSSQYRFRFDGINVRYQLTTTGRETTTLSSLQPIRNASIEYYVQGVKRYGPLTINTADLGEYDFNMHQPGVVTPAPLTIEVGTSDGENDVVLPMPTDPDYLLEDPNNIAVSISQVCYRGVSSDTISDRVFAVPLSTDAPTTCGLTATNALYYDPLVSPTRYFEDQNLTTAFSSAAGQYGISTIAADGGGAVSRVETISSNGTVTDSATIHCIAPYSIMLGYTPGTSTDLRQAACNASTTTNVFADRPREDFSSQDASPITILLRPDGTLSRASDGFYTDGTVLRRQSAGILGSNDAQGCSLIDARLPVTITGITSIQEGNNVTLTATSTQSGVSWQWGSVTNGSLISGGGTSNSITIRRDSAGVASVSVVGSKAGFRDGSDSHSVSFTSPAAPPPTDPQPEPDPGLMVTLSASPRTSGNASGSEVTITASQVTRVDTGAVVSGVSYNWTVDPDRTVRGGDGFNSVVINGSNQTINVSLTVSRSGFTPDTERVSVSFSAPDFVPNSIRLFSGTSNQLACDDSSADTTFYVNGTTLANSTIIYGSGSNAPTSDSARLSGTLYLRQNATNVRVSNNGILSNDVDCPPASVYTPLSMRYSASSGAASCSAPVGSFFVSPAGADFSNLTGIFTSAESGASRASNGYYSNGSESVYWNGTSISLRNTCPSVVFNDVSGSIGSLQRVVPTTNFINPTGNVVVTGAPATFTFELRANQTFSTTGTISWAFLLQIGNSRYTLDGFYGDASSSAIRIDLARTHTFELSPGTYSYTLSQIDISQGISGAVQVNVSQ